MIESAGALIESGAHQMPSINFSRAIPMVQFLAADCGVSIPEKFKNDQHFWYLATRNYWTQRKRIPQELGKIAELGKSNVRRLAIKNSLEQSVEHIQVENLAATDALTGAANRGALDSYLLNIFRHGRSNAIDLLVFFDIDKFKTFNDHYGHTVGDVVLKELIALMQNDVRGIDMLGRYGGEEFVLIMPEVSARSRNWRDDYQARIESMREKIERNLKVAVEKKDGVSIKEDAITASFGLLEIDDTLRLTYQPQKPDDLKPIYDLVDHELYTAKERGRNTIVFQGEPIKTHD